MLMLIDTYRWNGLRLSAGNATPIAEIVFKNKEGKTDLEQFCEDHKIKIDAVFLVQFSFPNEEVATMFKLRFM